MTKCNWCGQGIVEGKFHDCSKKPEWKKGDILAMPQDLCPRGSTVANGCAVFESEYDPELRGGVWCYGYRNADDIRKATQDDINKLGNQACRVIKMELDSLARLMELQSKLK